MAWTDDPATDELRHMQRKEDYLARHPICSICEEPIQDEHFYIIDNEYVCRECLDENYKVKTENYIQ